VECAVDDLNKFERKYIDEFDPAYNQDVLTKAKRNLLKQEIA
jgi:hypothetical protein